MSDFDSLHSGWLPPKAIVLKDNEVHVWQAELNLPRAQLESLWQILSVDEQQRAKRFVFQADQDKFIAARGLLRMILSRYLSMEPGKLGFSYGPYGKPELSAENEYGLCFNLSHSGELALYAVAVDQVGIDLERIQANLDCMAIAQRCFSSQEAAALQALPSSSRRNAFFRIWTCKEAYLKARGEGIFRALNQVEISLASTEANILRINGDPHVAINWSLLELHPKPGYVAALAILGTGRQVKCWQWQ